MIKNIISRPFLILSIVFLAISMSMFFWMVADKDFGTITTQQKGNMSNTNFFINSSTKE